MAAEVTTCCTCVHWDICSMLRDVEEVLRAHPEVLEKTGRAMRTGMRTEVLRTIARYCTHYRVDTAHH